MKDIVALAEETAPETRQETNIVACTELTWTGSRPPLKLRQAGVERLVGRTILERSSCLGSYGTGGPGFAGFLLSRTREFPKEWLVLVLWAADNWLLLNGRWVCAHPRWNGEQRAWQGWGEAESWDDFTPVIVGSRIAEAQICDDETRIHLEIPKTGARHLLEVPRDLSRLSRHGGSGEPRQWNPGESQRDAWILSRRADLRC